MIALTCSLLPPAATGLTSVIAREGHSCAAASSAGKAISARTAAVRLRRAMGAAILTDAWHSRSMWRPGAYAIACVLALLVQGCAAPPIDPATRPVTVTIAHLNDVYEIVPVEGGRAGGLARVATALER
jgi:anti-sigma-K factor RskA